MIIDYLKQNKIEFFEANKAKKQINRIIKILNPKENEEKENDRLDKQKINNYMVVLNSSIAIIALNIN